MTPAPVATDGEVFSRRATGLVRLGTPWRALVLNFANIGLTYITWLLAFASTYIAGEVRSSRRTQTAGTVGGTCMYAAVVTLLLAAIAIPVTLAFNKSAAWMNYNSDKYDEILPLDPTFVTWASALVDNAVVLAVVGIGLVTWSFFWLPSAMIIATRAIFAWSMERLVPARLSEVPSTHERADRGHAHRCGDRRAVPDRLLARLVHVPDAVPGVRVRVRRRLDRRDRRGLEAVLAHAACQGGVGPPDRPRACRFGRVAPSGSCTGAPRSTSRCRSTRWRSTPPGSSRLRERSSWCRSRRSSPFRPGVARAGSHSAPRTLGCLRSEMARDRLLFFATDLHGSQACFRKFLCAGDVYGAETLIMGCDITGKVIVPVHPAPHGHVARWRDFDHELATAADLDAFVRTVADAGGYAWLAERDEAAATFADDAATDALFTRLAAERVRAWVGLAEERLADGLQGFVIPGNDDADEIDAALAGGERLRPAEGTVAWLDDWLPMTSYGDSTPTPWNTPREVTEEAYAARLDELIGMLRCPGEAIFNLHVPPYGTPLDLAPSLDPDLRVRYTAAGDMLLGPVGSHAVRAAIERAQPVASLHGHVHESRGRARLGRSVYFNPGSDYRSGVLRGVLVKVSRKRGVADYAFTCG